jgi:hypothetical protein
MRNVSYFKKNNSSCCHAPTMRKAISYSGNEIHANKALYRTPKRRPLLLAPLSLSFG